MAVDSSGILYSGLSDLRLSAILHQEIGLLLADRADLMAHPAVSYYGDKSHQGSTVIEIPLVGLDGYDSMAAVAENADASVTALTDASPNITIARQALHRQMTDLAGFTDSLGMDLQRLAVSMVGAAKMRLTEMIANVTDDFTATAGTSGVDFSVDDWYDAQFALTQASVPGPYLTVLYPVQVTDLQNSLRAEAGATQFVPATQQMLDIKGPGFVGTFNGADIFASSKVPTANSGADSAGGMFGPGAVGYADFALPAPVRGGSEVIYPAGTRIFVEFERDAAGAFTKIVGNYYVGVSIIEDGRGVSIITDR